MKRFLLIATLLLTGIVVQAQCMLSPVSLNDRINNASFIAEGRVLNSTSYWNTEKNNIYTAHQVYVYKTFKGSFAGNPRTFYMITEGGTVGLDRQQVTSTLELEAGATGVFFCMPSNKQLADAAVLNGYDRFEAYSGPQGFVEFDENMQTATDPFNRYVINPELYNYIIDATGTKPVVLDEYEGNNSAVTAAAPTITSFTPDTASAGTKIVITINGTNFGNARGSSFVAFKNSDNGGSGTVEPVDVEYISWSDTKIQVEVPSKAGTGKFTVDNGGGNVQSGTNLVIPFAQLNVKDGNDIVYQPVHIGENGTGYTWQFYTGFNSNTQAKQAFLRAFQNWRCGTLINWDIGATTTINTIARDGVHVIRFDIGSELPNGVLGRCSSWWSGCIQGPTTTWYVAELDIVFDDAADWNFDVANPAFSQYDFESVAVHELGHGHQLGHVINSGEIMHYSISNGQTKRVLSSFGDLAGGNYVMDLNVAKAVCGKSVMVALNPTFCSLIPVAGFAPSLVSVCPGVQITFTDSSGGSTNSFNWNFGSGATPATATGKGPHTVSYTTSGSKTVQLIVGGVIGNDTSTQANLITVLPGTPAKPLAIVGPDTGCTKQQLFKTDSVPNATKYTWGINGGGNVSSSLDTFNTTTFTNPAAPHTIWVKASNSCGSSDSVTKSIAVIDVPTADFTFAIVNDTIQFTNTSTNSDDYLWKFDGQTAPAQNINLIPAQSGTYTVTLLASNFCGIDSISKQVVFIKSSVGELINKIGLSIYPNPARDVATVKIENSQRYGKLHFELYDVTGRSVTNAIITNDQTAVNVANLAAGMYMYKVFANGETLAAGRLVVK